MTLHNKAHNKAQGQFRTPRASVRALFTNGLMTGLAMGLIAIGSILLAFSCAPAAVGDVAALGAVTNLSIDETSVDSTSFVVQWDAPSNTGLKLDDTALDASELGYIIYYVAESADDTGVPSAMSIKQNPGVLKQEVTGVTETRILNLEPETRYFVAVASYNPFLELEAISGRVVEAITTVMTTNFEGTLSYDEMYTFFVQSNNTIRPTGTPRIPNGESVRYSIDRRSGAEFSTPGIDENGIITFNTSNEEGTAIYIVQASAADYTTQYATLTIEVTRGSTAPGAITNLIISEDDIESFSFEVQWRAPSETGTKLGGVPLDPAEISYRIYYLVEGEEQTLFPSAELVIQNLDVQMQEVTGVTSVRILDLESETRYFVTVVSSNSFEQLETVSNEVVEATTLAATTNLVGTLSYDEMYTFSVESSNTINPTGTPSIPDTDTDGKSIRYSIARRSGTEFRPSPSIDDSGVITVNPSSIAGTASYIVQASVVGYTIQYAILTIEIAGKTTAPGSVTNLVINADNIEGFSFPVQWDAPVETGTGLSGAALLPSEIGYRIYYLAGSADETRPSAESIRQNNSSRTQELLLGVTSTIVANLEPGTRYFVVVVSYNSLDPQLETVSDEAVEASTNANLEGDLSYDASYEFSVGSDETINPTGTPNIPDTDTSGEIIRYSIRRSSGAMFDPEPSIAEGTGIITVSQAISQGGTAIFVVQASALGYITQEASLTIKIVGSGVSTAPGAPTGLDVSVITSSVFVVNWDAPTDFGIDSDGAALLPSEIGYRVYYLVGSSGETAPTAESIKQNAGSQTQDFPGITSTTITGLEPGTRYFVTVGSYNPSDSNLETVSDEVVEASTPAITLDFEGTLLYDKRHEFFVRSDDTIAPTGIPSTLSSDSVRYSIARREGTVFSTKPSIAEGTGIITVSQIDNIGIATYVVQAWFPGYNIQEEILTIEVISRATAPGEVTGLTIDTDNVDVSSFPLQWTAPAETGTELYGVALDPTEIGYRIYYLAGTPGETAPTAESVRQNPDTQTQELLGLTDTIITDLEQDTRYFVTAVSYNSFDLQLETVLDEVVEVSTNATPVDFVGTLSYNERYEFGVEPSNTITPTGTPSIPGSDSIPGGDSIRYSITRTNGVELDPEPSIAEDTGIITVIQTRNIGEATYMVQASAPGYITQKARLTIEITGGAATAPGGITDLALDATATENISLTVQWTAPTNTGSNLDGSALDASEVGYRVYYITGVPGAKPTSEAMRQDPDVQTQEFVGVAKAKITGLLRSQRYYITVESYNPFDLQKSTAVTRVIGASTYSNLFYFVGSVSYEARYEFPLGSDETITPNSLPSLASSDPRDEGIIGYSIENSSIYTVQNLATINEKGVISVNKIERLGERTYIVKALAADYRAVSTNVVISIVEAIPFEGVLSYKENYAFAVGSEEIITPVSFPTKPDTDMSNKNIRYSIERVSGYANDFEIVLGENGMVTVSSSSYVRRDTYGSYIVRASLPGYATQEADLDVILLREENVLAGTYYSGPMRTDDTILGQAIEDSGDFSLANDDVILTVYGLSNGEYNVHFGSEADNYSESHQREVIGGNLELLKSDLTTNSFPFVDGAVIGISGSDIVGIKRVATYRPSNIYNDQDLQAMRKDLTRDYVLQNNIGFPGIETSNYEAVGDDINPFTGSLDGAGYSILDIKIVSSANYQGLFGVVEADSSDTIAVQNLTLDSPEIAGEAYVGSLAGWLRKGAVNDVRVTGSKIYASDVDLLLPYDLPDTSKIEIKIEVRGSVNIDGTDYGYGGGLIGRAGTSTTGIQVRIQNTSSEVSVVGSGANSNQIGGLIGEMGSDVVLTESYATGHVAGTNNKVGGLVGENSGVVIGNYATGSVLGRGSEAGGLVGKNSGTVVGYATGLVKGEGTILGGLVGLNSGIVTGYATGSILGSQNAGGLVGFNSGIMTGYAIGSVSGSDNIGGLVGFNSDGTVTGYARSIVRRNSGTNTTVGKTVGLLAGTDEAVISYNSMTESKLYDGEEGTTVLADVTGIDGVAVTIASATEADFSDFSFGTTYDEWTWVEDGKWPAINIGEFNPAAEQPLDPLASSR